MSLFHAGGRAKIEVSDLDFMPSQAVPGEKRLAGAASSCVVCGMPISGNVKVRLSRSQLQRCSACGAWVYFPRPAQAEQAAIHDNEDYFEHPYFKLRRDASEAQLQRCRQLFARLGASIDIASLRGQRLLDIGCDTGVFLAAAAREFGVVPVGLDVNGKAVGLAVHQGIEAYHAGVGQAPEHLRDLAAITAIDLVEHVSDPASFLREVRSRLCPGGVVYLETPNIQSAVYKIGRILSILTRGHSAVLYERLFPAQHVQYFTRESLTGLALASGLELTRVGTRVLPWCDIAASLFIRTAMAVMQTLDRLTGERILIWAILRRPDKNLSARPRLGRLWPPGARKLKRFRSGPRTSN